MFDVVMQPALLDGITGLVVGAAAVVLALAFLFVLLPILGVALELIAVIFIFSSGLLGRLVLGRPWIVEAKNLDDGERSVAYGVKGFRRAGEAVEELQATLTADGPPERVIAGERTTLPRPNV